ncbi:GNAT family N-acetyltransferase [Phanerochaete sordida]|uniref:GNAT family N-acetyltransferase n=1 Tax=Phanerochaete sordida TaxID=48140 RepID=A0A9P3GA88_9APHY|nr:GNAT family N-acetyltransferase [Phanerochaete sordida]
MSFVNTYTPPPAPAALADAELFGPEPYDVNFVFPILPASLENDRVKLVPFIPREHGEAYFTAGSADAQLWRYYPLVWRDLRGFLTWLEHGVRQNPAHVYFAVLDKTRPDAARPHWGGSLAGAFGLFNASAANLCAEIAYIAVLPGFQRSHVASNAVGILMRYCLELPTASPPGLGLRRVQWCAHTKNLPSARLAERMGFKREAWIRWLWVLPKELSSDGEKPREGDKWPERYGRHTLMLSTCWDDWEDGVREIVQKQVDRTA